MYSETTRNKMNTLEARLRAFGLNPTVRLTYNAVIVATIPTPSGGYIEVEYNHLDTCMYSTYGHTPSWDLKEVLNKVGISTTTQVQITSRDLELEDLCEGYLYNGNPITWYGYKAGVLDLETAEGSFSLELPCTLSKK